MLRNEKGFTLIELIMIIVILGILAAVAIPRYIDMRNDAADATARGVLGSLRSANSIMFAQRVLGNTTAAYTMGDIADGTNVQLQGVTYLAAATTIVVTVGANSYTFTLTPTPQAPTTVGTITSGTATW